MYASVPVSSHGIWKLVWPGDAKIVGTEIGSLNSNVPPPSVSGRGTAVAAACDVAIFTPNTEANDPGANCVVKLAAFTTPPGLITGWFAGAVPEVTVKLVELVAVPAEVVIVIGPL